MALAHRLQLRQGQSLVMTPQLQQAIKLLQLSNVELQEYVETEIERNPLLARAEGEGPALDNDAPEKVSERRDEMRLRADRSTRGGRAEVALSLNSSPGFPGEGDRALRRRLRRRSG